MPIGQYWGVIINISIIITIIWRIKSMFLNIPLGFKMLKKAFS